MQYDMVAIVSLAFSDRAGNMTMAVFATYQQHACKKTWISSVKTGLIIFHNIETIV